MHQFKKIFDDFYWIGGNDRRISLFESAYPVPNGISYNSYFLDDKKTVVVDTVDKSVSKIFFENIDKLLQGRPLDYVIINHMEPDHSATLEELIEKQRETKIVCNAKIKAMILQFFNFVDEDRFIIVKEGDSLSIGKHTFSFYMAPMVHWPEVMVTFESTMGVLFSADAFGTFGALSGNIYADEVNPDILGINEYRRYYTNIVGKYGVQVLNLLKKASSLDIKMICPLHGPIIRKNFSFFMDKYTKWASFTPENNEVLLAYASVYGNTENTAYILANELSDFGIKVNMYDVSVTHPSVILAEAFRCSHIVLAATTYNTNVFSSMEEVLREFKSHDLKNRTFAFIENGSWMPTAASVMKEMVGSMKNMSIIDDIVTVKSAPKPEQLDDIKALAEQIANSMPKPEQDSSSVEENAMFKISYGLFVLTSKFLDKDNGCIVNTVSQITDKPLQISVTVNKSNLTHDLIEKSGILNISTISTDANFALFKHFGFVSGNDTNKFANFDDAKRSENGLYFITKGTNSFISAKVVASIDCDTHTQFICAVTEAKNITDKPSMTYSYYFDFVKPTPQIDNEVKKGFVCKICGYVYEGDTLPDDFICPLCKHPASDFEPIK